MQVDNVWDIWHEIGGLHFVPIFTVALLKNQSLDHANIWRSIIELALCVFYMMFAKKKYFILLKMDRLYWIIYQILVNQSCSVEYLVLAIFFFWGGGVYVLRYYVLRTRCNTVCTTSFFPQEINCVYWIYMYQHDKERHFLSSYSDLFVNSHRLINCDIQKSCLR